MQCFLLHNLSRELQQQQQVDENNFLGTVRRDWHLLRRKEADADLFRNQNHIRSSTPAWRHSILGRLSALVHTPVFNDAINTHQ
jgi:hypothetical protein